jgi:hypothetical protein
VAAQHPVVEPDVRVEAARLSGLAKLRHVAGAAVVGRKGEERAVAKLLGQRLVQVLLDAADQIRGVTAQQPVRIMVAPPEGS